MINNRITLNNSNNYSSNKNNINSSNNKDNKDIKDNIVILESLFHFFIKLENKINFDYPNKYILLQDRIYIDANCDNRGDNSIGFLENTNQIISTIQDNKLSLDHLYKYLTYSTSSAIPIKYPYKVYDLFNYIPYDEAIKVFQLIDNNGKSSSGDHNSLSEISRVFIVLQFFVYYLNKFEKNEKEYYKFISKLILDESPLVNQCVYLIFKFINNKNTSIISFGLIFDGIFENIDKLNNIFNSSSTIKTQFKRNIENLLNHINNNNNQLSAFTNYIINHKPTTVSQYHFLLIFYKHLFTILKINPEQDIHHNILNKYKEIFQPSDYIDNGIKRTAEEVLELTRKRLKLEKNLEEYGYRFINSMNNSNYNTTALPNNIFVKIIRFTLRIDSFFKSSSQRNSNNNSSDIINSTRKCIITLASVSRNFHNNLSSIIEGMDWSDSKVDQLLFSNSLCSSISYGKLLTLVKCPSKRIRYETLIKTTPFEYVHLVFPQIESLVLESKLIESYDCFEPSYLTFPPKNSLKSLKELTIIGTDFSGKAIDKSINKNVSKTSTPGLYIINYIISNSNNIVKFTLINQSFYLYDDFELKVIQHLLKNHQSTLKVVKLKYKIVTANINQFISKVKPLLNKHKIALEINIL